MWTEFSTDVNANFLKKNTLKNKCVKLWSLYGIKLVFNIFKIESKHTHCFLQVVLNKTIVLWKYTTNRVQIQTQSKNQKMNFEESDNA